MYLNRLANIRTSDLDRSVFVLGPRQTGKSSYFKQQGEVPGITINLLDTKLRQQYEREPWLLRERILAMKPLPKVVLIDEIQLIPELLNEIHLMIEENGIHFIMTGSSARKLRKGGVNLLGGRADEKRFHPLSAYEIGISDFDLLRALQYGLLPSVYLSRSPGKILGSYVTHYLEQEIRQEGLVRSLPAFSRFLEIAALRSGTLMNMESIAKDAGIPRTTLYEYFSILYDTLLAFELEPWTRSTKRKPAKASKFYFFDVGVARKIAGFPVLNRRSLDLGNAFEHWILHEIKTWSDYNDMNADIRFWRTTTDIEVDFVINESVAIEVKATEKIVRDDLKGLKEIAKEGVAGLYMVCLEPFERIHEGITILPWQKFIENLWRGELNIALK